MQINIIKKHSEYPLGTVDVEEGRAEYLLRMGVAEMVENDHTDAPKKQETEKVSKDLSTEVKKHARHKKQK